MIKEAYPLQWPVTWKRSSKPTHSRFGKWNAKPTIAQGADLIREELRRLTGSSADIIISTNLKYKNDGTPYSNQREPEDQGVAVYFMMDKKQMVIACDSFNKIGCNLYAIGKTIEAMRGIDRWGCSELLQKAFTGFAALPMPAQRNWWDILECKEDSDSVIIKGQYRRLAQMYHPDKPVTGNQAKFQEVQFAYEQAVKAKS